MEPTQTVDLVQLLGGFDPRILLGLGGVAIIESVVEWLKNKETGFGLPGKWAPVVAVVFGVLFNVALAWGFGLAMGLKTAAMMGFLTGGFATIWHEVKVGNRPPEAKEELPEIPYLNEGQDSTQVEVPLTGTVQKP